MISAVIGVILAIISFVTTVPMLLPIVGLAMGANALLKEEKNTPKNKTILILAAIAIILNGTVIGLFFLAK